ncbi:MAG: hypothetical protein ACI4JM_10075, partial [Oscillospiraceae bacterium]
SKACGFQRQSLWSLERAKRGCGGGSPRPKWRSKKFFGNLFIKKGWAAFSRLMKFSVNYNGRPLVAPTKVIHRTHVTDNQKRRLIAALY